MLKVVAFVDKRGVSLAMHKSFSPFVESLKTDLFLLFGYQVSSVTSSKMQQNRSNLKSITSLLSSHDIDQVVKKAPFATRHGILKSGRMNEGGRFQCCCRVVPRTKNRVKYARFLVRRWPFDILDVSPRRIIHPIEAANMQKFQCPSSRQTFVIL